MSSRLVTSRGLSAEQEREVAAFFALHGIVKRDGTGTGQASKQRTAAVQQKASELRLPTKDLQQ
jgi:hypothetical protein